MPAPEGTGLTVALVLLPLFGAVCCFLVPRFARWIAGAVTVAVLVNVLALASLLRSSGPLRYQIGGWGAPLGIDLYLDGLASFMLLTTAVTAAGVCVYGWRYFAAEADRAGGFWPLWLFLWMAMNALYLSGDVFNLYVTLELTAISAAVLVALAGGPEALPGALRYLLMTLVASLCYLLGVGLLYHVIGTLDIAHLGAALAEGLGRGPTAVVALGLMVAALCAKSALFPLHFWLPPAHASAPAPVSALLSALVVKATVYLLLRVWLDVIPGTPAALGTALGALGAGAILWGSLQALRQTRLKLLIAYSTVAQLGYLFLPFGVRAAEIAATAWRGALYFLLCHALAKAAMFLAAGNFDRLQNAESLDDVRRAARHLPMSLAAFGIAGITLIGLPPSGGFIGKWLLIEASLAAGEWWLVVVVLLGGLLSAVYVFKVVALGFTQPTDREPAGETDRAMEWVVLLLAAGTLVLGFVALPLLSLMEIGAPFGSLAAEAASAPAGEAP